MATMLWRRHDGNGLDRVVIERGPEGVRIAGTSLLVVDDAPFEIRYSVMTDADGLTRVVGAHVQGSGNDRRLALTSDGEGTWSVSDEPILDLYGATDIDLGWTPATNTLPILRLGLDVGESAQISAALVLFPEHHVERRTQTYERLDATTYRYVSATFEGTLTVDEAGLVSEHSGGWSAIAAS
jgi:hypothetical protein